MSSTDIKTTMNVTYGIMTMVYLLSVGVMNTLSIRIYQEDVIIPYKSFNKKVEGLKTELETLFPNLGGIRQASEEQIKRAELFKRAKVVEEQIKTLYPKFNTDEFSIKDATEEQVKAAEEEESKKQTFTDIKEHFGQEEELKTEIKETSVVDKNAIAIIEAIMMAITIPLAFGYIIGFDCSCPTDGDDKHVGKIIFCFGVFIPMVYIIVSEIVSLLIPDKDWLNPFLPPNSSKEAQDKHFFNRQYRKTFCWCLITLTFIIHFFSVAFGSNSSSGGGSIDVY